MGRPLGTASFYAAQIGQHHKWVAFLAGGIVSLPGRQAERPKKPSAAPPL